MNAILEENKFILIGAGVALLALVFLVKKNGGVAGAAAAVGAGAANAAVNVVNGAAVGTVDAVGQTVGLPPLNQEIDDPVQCRAGIDANGHVWGLGHCTASAYWKAVFSSSTPLKQATPASTAPADGMVTIDDPINGYSTEPAAPKMSTDPVSNSDTGMNFNYF